MMLQSLEQTEQPKRKRGRPRKIKLSDQLNNKLKDDMRVRSVKQLEVARDVALINEVNENSPVLTTPVLTVPHSPDGTFAKKYTEQEKIVVLNKVLLNGVSATVRETGIAKSTIWRWQAAQKGMPEIIEDLSDLTYEDLDVRIDYHLNTASFFEAEKNKRKADKENARARMEQEIDRIRQDFEEKYQ